MNLNYVKEYLKGRKDRITPEDIDSLLREIEAYQGVGDTLTDISKVMRVVNEQSSFILTKMEEYEAYPSDDIKTIRERTEKAREILCLLGSLNTYLMLSLNSINDNTYETKSIKKYLISLKDKREHYQSERMAWITILKSLTQEMNFYTEMRRMDIEDKIGFNKYNET